MTRLLITGITGFVGSHLAEFALARGVAVSGSCRWRSKTENIDHIRDRIELIDCDIRDLSSVQNLLDHSVPDYIVHLAAQSFVAASWQAPAETLSTNIIGQVNLLEQQVAINVRIERLPGVDAYARHALHVAHGQALADEARVVAINHVLGYRVGEGEQEAGRRAKRLAGREHTLEDRFLVAVQAGRDARPAGIGLEPLERAGRFAGEDEAFVQACVVDQEHAVVHADAHGFGASRKVLVPDLAIGRAIHQQVQVFPVQIRQH